MPRKYSEILKHLEILSNFGEPYFTSQREAVANEAMEAMYREEKEEESAQNNIKVVMDKPK